MLMFMLWLQVAALAFRTFLQHKSRTSALASVSPVQAVSHVLHQVCSLNAEDVWETPTCLTKVCMSAIENLGQLLMPWLQDSGTLTERSAKQLLLQWQNVKADALGDHVLSPMESC